MTARKGCAAPPLSELAGVDELSLEVFRAFMRAMHLHRQLMTRTLATSGSHIGHIGCLRVLAGNDGVTQRDLADMLHVSRPSVTSMLQTLEKEGIVERHADERDQRLTRVYLTAEGRAEEARQREVLAGFLSTTLGRMSETDRRELARLLTGLNENTAAALAGEALEEETGPAR